MTGGKSCIRGMRLTVGAVVGMVAAGRTNGEILRTITRAGNIGFARRPQYLFSGLSKCGVCGAGFIMAGRNRLACFGAREKDTCDNHLTVRRDEVEARVLKALQEKLLRQDLFEEFCEEFTREMNRLRMQHRASLSAAEHEIERIEARRKKLIEMVMEGVAPSVVKDELNANVARPRGRHRAHARPGWRDASDRVEGEFGGHAGGHCTNEEVVGIRRPLPASIFGCGGPQQIVPAALLGGSVKVKTLAFPTEVPDVRRSLG
ncbi:MAG: recombinase zinc beta ribbon domain-containing protein [Gemmatimonadaceae bacterium]